MHDEATLHCIDLIDQTILGHYFILDELGKKPRLGARLILLGILLFRLNCLVRGSVVTEEAQTSKVLRRHRSDRQSTYSTASDGSPRSRTSSTNYYANHDRSRSNHEEYYKDYSKSSKYRYSSDREGTTFKSHHIVETTTERSVIRASGSSVRASSRYGGKSNQAKSYSNRLQPAENGENGQEYVPGGQYHELSKSPLLEMEYNSDHARDLARKEPKRMKND